MTPRTYLVALVDGGGTVPPELAVVRGLVERGHHVTVLAEDTMVDEVRRPAPPSGRGSRARTGRRGGPRTTRTATGSARTRWRCSSRLLDQQFVGPAPAYAADTTPAIQDLSPMSWSAPCSPSGRWWRPRRPACPTPCSTRTSTCSPFPAARRSASACAGRRAIGRLRDRAIGRSAPGRGRRAAPLDEVRADYGLAPLDCFWDQVQGADLELVLAAESFDFPGPLPANVRYVGPVLDDPAWSGPGRPRPATRRSCWSGCRPRSRTRSRASSASSTGSPSCRCAWSSPPARRSTPTRCTRRPTSRSSPPRRTRRCWPTRPRSSPTAGTARS